MDSITGWLQRRRSSVSDQRSAVSAAASAGQSEGLITSWLQRRRSSVTERSFSSAVSAAASAGHAEGLNLSKPIFQGRVFKQFRNENGFNKRYMVLYPGVLIYYKHERDYKRDMKKQLTGCKVLKLTGLYLTKVEEPPAGCKYCFNLHLPDPFNERSQMLLVVKSRRLKRQWMTYLQAQNPHLLPSPSKRKTSIIQELPVRLIEERYSLTGVSRIDNGIRRPSLRRTISF